MLGGRGMNVALWSLSRLWIRYRRGRWPPASVHGPIWYFGYGSNMNERLFRGRRHMALVEARTGLLEGYRLAFTAAGGMRPSISAPANIVAALGQVVCGALYLLQWRKFACLDPSADRQYAYLWTVAQDGAGNRLPVVTDKVPQAAPGGRPGRRYLGLMREAARRRGLPAEYITALDR